MPDRPPSPPGGNESRFRLVTRAATDTRRVAAVLGALLEGGEVLGLVGGLGAGKTCFVQGLATGLGVPPEAYVCSPTFALWSHHQGRLPLFHVDLYRLADPEEVTFIGYEDLYDGVAVVAIEWFDAFPELWPAAFLRIDMTDGAEEPHGSAHLEGAWPVDTGRSEGASEVVAGNEVDRAALEEDPERGSRTLQFSGVGQRYEALVRRFHAALHGAGLVPEAGADRET